MARYRLAAEDAIPQNEIRRISRSLEFVGNYARDRRYGPDGRALRRRSFPEYNIHLRREIEVLETLVRFSPHNFPQINHLDLAEAHYRRTLQEPFGEFRENLRNFSDEGLRSLYVDMTVYVILTSILARIIEDPEIISRVTEDFIDYAQFHMSINVRECIPLLEFLLRAAHQQLYPHGNLIVLILSTYCRNTLHKDAFSGINFSHQCLEYILESCRRVRFNFRHFFRHCKGRLRDYDIRYCPIRRCILNDHMQAEKVRSFVRYGFEPLDIGDDANKALYMEDKFRQLMWRKRIHPSVNLDSHNFYILKRRDDFKFLLLYMVFASLGVDSDQWIECSKLFFSTILDPLFLESELIGTLYALCHRSEHKRIFRVCREDFSHLFVENHTPRKLKHQCRYVIRRSLSDNLMLPLGIDQLHLPRALTSYLQLEDYLNIKYFD